MNLITPKEARAMGYKPLTTGYALPTEKWMLDNVLADMARAKIEVALIDGFEGPEVWRLPRGKQQTTNQQ